jgi:hypothetical protein
MTKPQLPIIPRHARSIVAHPIRTRLVRIENGTGLSKIKMELGWTAQKQLFISEKGIEIYDNPFA